MKKVYVASLGLPKGFPIMEYESVDEILKDGGSAVVKYNDLQMEALAAVANSYLHQKGALVEGRGDLATWLTEVVKFPLAPAVPAATRKVKKTVDGVEKEVDEPVMETEGVYIKRFIALLVAGKTTTPLVPVTGTDAKAREASAWATIQLLVEKPLKLTINGKEETLFSLKNDIKRPVAQPKAKTPPAYALDAAGNIIANKSEAKWAKTFDAEGVPYSSFTEVKDPEGNKVRLAWAIQAREQMKSKKEYN